MSAALQHLKSACQEYASVQIQAPFQYPPDPQPSDSCYNDDGNAQGNDNEEEDEIVCGNQNSLLDTDISSEGTRHLKFNVAPTEGLSPLGVFLDVHAEELAYPTIFGGKYRTPNHERSKSVTYKDIVKSELRNVDRRCASNISNIFFKFKKLQLQDVTSSVSVRIRQGKDRHGFTAKDVRNPATLQTLVNKDLGYKFFKHVRGTPEYWDTCKKDLFAMLRMLGMPTLFVTVSMADTKWKKLIGNLLHLKTGATGCAL
jgi:ribosomal protein S6E (S10)